MASIGSLNNMKKLLTLLFSLMLSFNSYGETIICSGEVENDNDILGPIKFTYKRDGNNFIYVTPEGYEAFKLDIAYEDIFTIVLQINSTFSLDAISIDKRTKDFTSIALQTPTVLYTSTGKCEFVE